VTRERIDQILQEYEAVRDPSGDPELEALRAAVFVEDVFGISLTDAEITLDSLGTRDATRSVILRHLEVA
jgi:hypothetical protein